MPIVDTKKLKSISEIEKYFHALDFDCIKHTFTPSCLPLEFRQMVVHQTQAMYKYTN